MDKVGVTGDGVDLAAGLLKSLVMLLEIRELCRADEGEVRGIEEKDAPFSPDILFTHCLEAVVVECLYAELADFLAYHGHKKTSFL